MSKKRYTLLVDLARQAISSAGLVAGSQSMKITGKFRVITKTILLAVSLLLSMAASSVYAQAVLQDINFASLPGSRFEIELKFSQSPPAPDVFLLESPARLTMDFANVRSELEERRFPLNFNMADSVMILEAQGRTRMVVNLNAAAPHTTRTVGNSLFVVVGEQAANASAANVAAAAQTTDDAPNNNFVSVNSDSSDISGIDFRRRADDTGQIIIKLSNPGLNANIREVGTRLLVEFNNASVGREQQVRLDVTDYPTPVQAVSLYNEDGKVVVLAEMLGEFEYLAYQSGSEYIVNIMSQAVAASTVRPDGMAQFSGEKTSLSFQDIEVRTVLQILAEFNDFSLVMGDNVGGTMALHLEDVPWDQALDTILRYQGLAQRQVGTILYIAPAEEIEAAELQELQATQNTEALAPLVTEYLEVNYANASDMLALFQGVGGEGAGRGGVLSARGRASVDARTSTIIIQDVQKVVDSIKSLLARLDVPPRQVLIEARIVNASTSFSKSLGIRWGGAQSFPQASDQFLLTGSMESTLELETNLANYSQAIAQAVNGGSSLNEAIANNTLLGPSFPDALAVDLGITTGGASSIAIGYQGDNGLLQLELSALEANGDGEVIAQPKITTQNLQQARIESGLQIPYQAQAGGTAGGSTTEFVTAALSLDVTPQITPDGRIIMLLDIHQDSIVPGSGSVPAIATNSLNTRVLVNDGDTIVLGGVFREEVTTSITKTPLLGDLPYIGNLFKRTENAETKTELLIFITPSIMNDIL